MVADLEKQIKGPASARSQQARRLLSQESARLIREEPSVDEQRSFERFDVPARQSFIVQNFASGSRLSDSIPIND